MMYFTPFNPSRKAMRKVKDPFPIPKVCHLCCGKVEISTHEKVYAGKSFGNWPWLYLCTKCGARVGMHPMTSIPLGTLADSATRKARMENKIYFNRMFMRDSYCDAPVNSKFKCGRRTECYAWLARKLGIDVHECHWGLFESDTCIKAGEMCRHKLMSGGFQ